MTAEPTHDSRDWSEMTDEEIDAILTQVIDTLPDEPNSIPVEEAFPD